MNQRLGIWGAILRFMRLMALTALGVVLSASAQAADVAGRNSTKVVTIDPAYDWSGAYIGLTAGGAWGRVAPNYAAQSGLISSIGLPIVQSSTNPSMNSSGFVGGAQIGYNFQSGGLVYGLEADVSYVGLGKTRFSGPFGLPVCGVPCTTMQSYGTDWLATFRGRLGVTTGNWFIYGTGGLALADVRHSDTFSFPIAVFAASSNGVRTGWALGAGAEWALNSNWTVKAEYLYVDLGSASYVMRSSAFPAAYLRIDHDLVENIARLGINYRF